MTEWNAADYSRIAQLQEHMAAEAMGLLDLKSAERVLDVGCGNGRVTARIASAIPQGSVVGVDASPQMIDFAARPDCPPALSNLRLERADARSLPFRDEFDFVVSFNTLHWISHQDVALRSIHTTLKSTGIAQVRLVPAGNRKSLENVIDETRCSARWASAFNNFSDPYLHWSAGEYAVAAERNRFRVPALSTEDKAWDFEARDAFIAFGMVTFVEWTTTAARGSEGCLRDRCSGSIPASHRAGRGRGKRIQVLSDGYNAGSGVRLAGVSRLHRTRRGPAPHNYLSAISTPPDA
jgi:ubiquinone/menaquinone biosynthesis C-methylase UbiE